MKKYRVRYLEPPQWRWFGPTIIFECNDESKEHAIELCKKDNPGVVYVYSCRIIKRFTNC